MIRTVMINKSTNSIAVRSLGSLAALSIAAASIAGALVTAPGIALAAGAGMPSGGGATTSQSPPAQPKSQAKKKAPGG